VTRRWPPQTRYTLRRNTTSIGKVWAVGNFFTILITNFVHILGL